jgi:hypothetical protein
MYPNILSPEQLEIVPLMQKFSREFYLVGGTAIALQIGHRKSIDFDMFKSTKLNTKRILNKIDESKLKYTITRRVYEQLNLSMLGVKITFFEYPYSIEPTIKFEGIRMPDLQTLAAMKAFVLGRRSKWKDYVDLYFLLRDYLKLEDIFVKAKEIYGQEFSEKQFCAQLAFHKDIDYTETVEYLPGFAVGEQEIKDFLTEQALSI